MKKLPTLLVIAGLVVACVGIYYQNTRLHKELNQPPFIESAYIVSNCGNVGGVLFVWSDGKTHPLAYSQESESIIYEGLSIIEEKNIGYFQIFDKCDGST